MGQISRGIQPGHWPKESRSRWTGPLRAYKQSNSALGAAGAVKVAQDAILCCACVTAPTTPVAGLPRHAVTERATQGHKRGCWCRASVGLFAQQLGSWPCQCHHSDLAGSVMFLLCLCDSSSSACCWPAMSCCCLQPRTGRLDCTGAARSSKAHTSHTRSCCRGRLQAPEGMKLQQGFFCRPADGWHGLLRAAGQGFGR
jgi:hypothetical protein